MSETSPTSAPREEPAGQPAAGPLMGEAIARWQRDLAGLGGPNTLLWHRDLPDGTLDLTTAHPGGVSKLLAGRPTRLGELVREPSALAEARRRARAIRGKTVEMAEERGLATGYLAVGMATWAGRGSAGSPSAPVLLRTCELRPVDAAESDFVVDLGPDAEFNPVLAQYLRAERGIDIDVAHLEAIAVTGTRFDPYPVYAALRHLCAPLPDFTVTPRLVLGNFPYDKLAMVADLAAQGDRLGSHRVVAALAGDETARAALDRPVPEGAPDHDPGHEHLVLDADSSQQAVIDAVRGGADLVVTGPPGTGKSQTIANLIAALAGDGKSVLFVAEKRAAVDQVLGRLRDLGLGDLVLDTHGGSGGQRGLVSRVAEIVARHSRPAPPDTRSSDEELRVARDTLAAHRDSLHRVREPWQVSVHRAQEEVAELEARELPPRTRVRLRGDDLLALDPARRESLWADLDEAGTAGAWSVDPGAPDPWWGADISTEADAARAEEIVTRLDAGGFKEVGTRLDTLLEEAGLPEAVTGADWGRSLAAIREAASVLEVFRPEVFDIPLADMVGATGSRTYRKEHSISLSLPARQRLRRQAIGLLRPGPVPEDLHGVLRQAQNVRVGWQGLTGIGGRPRAPHDTAAAAAAHARLEEELRWLGDRLSPGAGERELLDLPIGDLRSRIGALAGSLDRLRVLPTVAPSLGRLRAAGLGPLVDDLAARRVPADSARPELDFVFWTSVAEAVATSDGVYGGHQGDRMRSVAADFVAQDRAHVASGPDRVRAEVGRRLGRAIAAYPEQVESVRAAERDGRPLRALVASAPELLSAAAPCFAMSPLVVASVMPPGEHVDVVIFDEASQIPPALAASAISRGRQVVVVGDPHQMPPSGFLTAATELSTDGGDAAPSVLDVLADVLPTRSLDWHYRSHDARLIDFSSERLYGGSITTFPGTLRGDIVRVEQVEGGGGVIEQGSATVESTPDEVDRVVQLVLDHARRRPKRSLAVITLGRLHAERIDEALRRALVGADKETAAFFDESRAERFFVKDIERVQGDERDAVILAIGYAATLHGQVPHRFGAVSAEGGDRRLNVAITRARRSMTVVTSLTSDQLAGASLRGAGAEMLRDYLAYAERHGQVDDEPPLDAPEASGALRAGLARRLREAGLVVHEQHGRSAGRIDVAVEDPHRPGRMKVAVETDGEAYAGMASVRDRDRLRPEHLERLGWAHVRVWTTDLFRDPAREVARVLEVARHEPPRERPARKRTELPGTFENVDPSLFLGEK
ncbi:AAA domain-containing protein [Actinomycetota bacterium]